MLAPICRNVPDNTDVHGSKPSQPFGVLVSSGERPRTIHMCDKYVQDVQSKIQLGGCRTIWNGTKCCTALTYLKIH